MPDLTTSSTSTPIGRMTPIGPGSSRLYSTFYRYFSGPLAGLQEALQNACRAASQSPTPSLEITLTMFDGDSVQVTIQDNGPGIQDPGPMLTLGETGWSAEIQAQQDPAGAGVIGMLAFARSVTWSSQFGSLTVDSEAFKEEAYRADLHNHVEAVPLRHGTRVTLSGLQVNFYSADNFIKDALARLDGIEFRYQTSDSRTCSPKDIKVKSLWEQVGEPLVERPGWQAWDKNPLGEGWGANQTVIWFGHKIRCQVVEDRGVELPGIPGRYVLRDPQILVNCQDLSLVTPKLPDREAMINDDKFKAFRGKVSGALLTRIGDRMSGLLASSFQQAGIPYTWPSPEYPRVSPLRVLRAIEEALYQSGFIKETAAELLAAYYPVNRERDLHEIPGGDEDETPNYQWVGPATPRCQGVIFVRETGGLVGCLGWRDLVLWLEADDANPLPFAPVGEGADHLLYCRLPDLAGQTSWRSGWVEGGPALYLVPGVLEGTEDDPEPACPDGIPDLASMEPCGTVERAIASLSGGFHEANPGSYLWVGTPDQEAEYLLETLEGQALEYERRNDDNPETIQEIKATFQAFRAAHWGARASAVQEALEIALGIKNLRNRTLTIHLEGRQVVVDAYQNDKAKIITLL